MAVNGRRARCRCGVDVCAQDSRMGDGGHDVVGRLTRIQSRVLHDDRLVGFDEGSEAGAARYRRRILQVIEAQVTSVVPAR